MKQTRTLLMLFSLSFLSSCGIFGPDEIDISGITRTFDDGTVAENDPDDWKIQGVVGAGQPFFSVKPAYPNPVSSEKKINFVFSLEVPADVQFNVVNKEGEKIQQIFSLRLENGNHSITWDLTDSDGKKVSPGLYRVTATFVDAPKGENHLSTYGDIEIE
ncbi:MAG: FlgD immunoglobulin-like domain containing protein [Candidatus Kapaibacterium sp.]